MNAFFRIVWVLMTLLSTIMNPLTNDVIHSYVQTGQVAWSIKTNVNCAHNKQCVVWKTAVHIANNTTNVCLFYTHSPKVNGAVLPIIINTREQTCSDNLTDFRIQQLLIFIIFTTNFASMALIGFDLLF